MSTRGLEFNRSLLRGCIPSEHSSYDVNNTVDMGGMTPLHWMCIKHLYCDTSEEAGNLNIMKWIVHIGADTDVTTRTLGYTPLHLLSLGPDSEEKEMSSIWSYIIEKYHDRSLNNKNINKAMESAVQVLLDGGAKIIRNRTHNLTPLCLYLLKCNNNKMTIQNVLRVFPVGLSTRDVMELSTLKFCSHKNNEQLLKIMALTVKHGCRYVRSLEWNLSLSKQDRDLLILVLANEIFDGKLLPDYIPLVLPLEGRCRNEIFPLENIELLDQIRDVLSVFRSFGMEGVSAALNLLICEESMYISFEEITKIFSQTISIFANEYCLDLIKSILYQYVSTSVDRYSFSMGGKGMNYLGVGCVMMLLDWLEVRRDDKHVVKQIISHLVKEFEMTSILHRVLEIIGKQVQQKSQECQILTSFEWEDELESIFELLETQINVLDYNGDTCLHVAIGNLDFTMTSYLLEHNAYPYAKNKLGKSCINLIRTAINQNRSSGDEPVVKLADKIELLDTAPTMLKVICAETVIQHGLWMSQGSLPASTRSILELHGYKPENDNSPPALLP